MNIADFLSEQHRLGRFAGSALVRHGAETLVNQGYGDANREQERPNSPRTAFQLCSTSKQFTAAAILLLRQQGKLSVSDPICRWIPDCPEHWTTITMHHLLTHTSGLGHWFHYPDLDLCRPKDRATLLRIFQRDPLRFQPGTAWSYSSPGFVLLAHIVEQVSGEPYASFLRETIFRPLNMNHTGAGNSAPEPEQQATGYANNQTAPSFELDTVGVGAGDVWSTTEDMLRWNAALAAPGLLSKDSLQIMLALHAGTADSFLDLIESSYGYGTYLGELQGHSLIFHPGHNAGFRAMSIMLPDDDADVILLSNEEATDLESVSKPIVTQLIGLANGEALRATRFE